MVILATPMTTDTQNMSIEGLDEEVNFPGKYHQTVATLVDGDLNPEYFGLTDDTMTETIFFVDSKFPINRSIRVHSQFWNVARTLQIWQCMYKYIYIVQLYTKH